MLYHKKDAKAWVRVTVEQPGKYTEKSLKFSWSGGQNAWRGVIENRCGEAGGGSQGLTCQNREIKLHSAARDTKPFWAEKQQIRIVLQGCKAPSNVQIACIRKSETLRIQIKQLCQ